MYVHGHHQTTYADWSRSVFSLYQKSITFEFVREEDKVLVKSDDVIIAYYDFGQGGGFIESTDIEPNIELMGQWQQLEEINVDSIVSVV